jgi:hypothetical protein
MRNKSTKKPTREITKGKTKRSVRKTTWQKMEGIVRSSNGNTGGEFQNRS